MRLGQLARKYDVSLQEIISYLKEAEPTIGEVRSNSKLDEQTELLVMTHFDLSLDLPLESLEEPSKEILEEEQKLVEPEVTEEIVAIEKVVETKEPVDVPLDQIEEIPLQREELDLPKAEVEIETDRLLELLEMEDTSVDLSKVTRIKSPKKELEGLKVVGKIDLPEPKKRSVEIDDQLEDIEHQKNQRHKRQQLSNEDRESRRLKAKKKKEEYDIRLEQRRKEKERKEKKTLKEAHYRQKIQQAKATKPKLKDKVQEHHTSLEVIEQSPKPKRFFGKVWKWLNT
ncbi:MAG: hypothetical protein GY816_02445 [Cytophagales bacterium]|nr:hypothetical protein [Cytophagales bacterium]